MSSTKHYVDLNGKYIGGFGDGAEPPQGSVEVPRPPSAFHTWDGSSWVPPAATPGQVNTERTRRLEAGTVIDISGYGPVAVQGRDQDQITILALETSARDLMAAGVVDPVVPFRDRDNVQHMLTPSQTVDLMRKAKSFAQLIYQSSWDLKDGDPIPQDYTDDKHWPKAEGETA